MTVARTGAHQCTVSDSVAVNININSDVAVDVDMDVEICWTTAASSSSTFVAVCCLPFVVRCLLFVVAASQLC